MHHVAERSITRSAELRTPRGPGNEILWELVEALCHVPVLADLYGRNLVVGLLGDELGEVLPVQEQPVMSRHLVDIVIVCWDRPLGLKALARVVGQFDQGSLHMARVRDIVFDMTVLPYWQADARNAVIALLREVDVDDVDEVYRLVAGPTAPELPRGATFLDAFSLLESLNASPEGLPKPLVFIEHLAIRSRPEVALELHRWTSLQAVEFELGDELKAVRQAVRTTAVSVERVGRAEGFAVFSLQRVGVTGDSYQLVHWRQLGSEDGWHPTRIDEHTGDLASVKNKVAVHIEDVEDHWADLDLVVQVEFVLSNDVLNLDVDQWTSEAETAMPVPLGCQYPVVVRSLERMGKRTWLRAWRARWGELRSQLDNGGVVAEASNRWGGNGTEADLRAMTADFARNPRAVSLVLSAPPCAASAGCDEIAVGLRAGLPVIVWHREACDAGFLQAAHGLLHGTSEFDLLERVRWIRADAYAAGPGSGHCGHALTILYDDPSRRLVPHHPRGPEGAAA
jgi:hypothetical protein